MSESPRCSAMSDVPAVIEEINTNSEKYKILNTGGLHFVPYNDKKYFAIHKHEQKNLDFDAVRREILVRLELPVNTKVTQVIGNCIPYSPSGTCKITNIITSVLKDPNRLLLWGYTGCTKNRGDQCDINMILNLWVDSCVTHSCRSLASIVDRDTHLALTEWGCVGAANVKNMYLVYGDVEFGDDVFSSDFITDEAYCFEGGVQCFRQLINLLTRNVHVKCHFGLRDSAVYFSASEFMEWLQRNVRRRKEEVGDPMQIDGTQNMNAEIDNTMLDSWKNTYIEHRPVCDPNRRDFGQRMAMFQIVWQLFLDMKVWRKLHLCVFEDLTECEHIIVY